MDCRDVVHVALACCSSRGELLGSSAAVFIEYESTRTPCTPCNKCTYTLDYARSRTNVDLDFVLGRDMSKLVLIMLLMIR